MKRARAALALTTVSALFAACMSATEGESLTRRVRAIESGQEEHQEHLRQQIATAETKVGELEGVLDQATKLVTRASADTGAQVEHLQEQVMTLEGQLAELRNEVQRQNTQMTEQQGEMERQLKKISAHVGLDTALAESEIPAGADEHFAAAEQAFQQRQFARARALYRAFIERHGRDERVDNAQYRIGASHMEEDRPATALGELRRVISDHPQGDVADASLLAMGNAFYALHACTDARSALEALIRAHARSPLVGQARTRLREIQRAPRTYCTR